MTSIITAVMNRSEILTEGIRNWLSLDFVDEIVVVDWSSSEPFEFCHDKVRVYRVEGEKHWKLTHALNLAASLAMGDIIIKCDSDYRLDDRIKDFANLKPKHFCRGDWSLAEADNDIYINGFCIFHKEDFDSVGGYNEAIQSYGWDDDDLYQRLRLAGCQQTSLAVSSGIYHKPHAEEMRTVNQDTEKTPKEMTEDNRKSCPKWSASSPRNKWRLMARRVTDENISP
jgi:glycosyltransferase involved in cell wall biosynthesis